jgi:hypothetical protein
MKWRKMRIRHEGEIAVSGPSYHLAGAWRSAHTRGGAGSDWSTTRLLADCSRVSRSASGVRRWPRHRRHPARRPGRQPRTHRVRRCVRQTLRGLAHRSIQRQNRAAPTQQRRKPRRQPRPACHLRCPTPPPPTHPRLPRPPHRRRQDKSRNHALHKEIHRPRDLPRRSAHPPRNPYTNHCHNIVSI